MTLDGRIPQISERTAGWSDWVTSRMLSVGIEEEVMLLDPLDWSLAQRADQVVPRLSGGLRQRATLETHQAVIEMASPPGETVNHAIAEIEQLRRGLAEELEGMGLRVASAGTHPAALWSDMEVSSGERHQLVYGSMRELARREPTFALHVHLGVPDPESAIRLHNRLRAHLPLLLALSGNSPFWQGRDTGLASARTPVFQAFPRVGIPRAFSDYEQYVETVDLLIRCDAFPESTFLWWDVRPQPKFGTVEIRVMDAQSTTAHTGALVTLVQAIARLELEEGFASPHLLNAPEVLDENRFLAARDGMEARLIDPVLERRVPAREQLAKLLEVLRPHAEDLGTDLDPVIDLAEGSGAEFQRSLAGEERRFDSLLSRISELFADSARAPVSSAAWQ